ncbi:helix-turn-helix transcriptional regulator [bacterium]|nr:helix-turn-helix transcriptional regulator [bacterium]
MTRSVFTGRYERLRKLLVGARKAAGMTQAELAAKLRRPQSYVSKYERGERRLDVIEFLEVAKAVGADPVAILQEI